MEDVLMEIVKDRVDEKASAAVSKAVRTAEAVKEQQTTVMKDSGSGSSDVGSETGSRWSAVMGS